MVPVWNATQGWNELTTDLYNHSSSFIRQKDESQNVLQENKTL